MDLGLDLGLDLDLDLDLGLGLGLGLGLPGMGLPGMGLADGWAFPWLLAARRSRPAGEVLSCRDKKGPKETLPNFPARPCR